MQTQEKTISTLHNEQAKAGPAGFRIPACILVTQMTRIRHDMLFPSYEQQTRVFWRKAYPQRTYDYLQVEAGIGAHIAE